MYQSVGAKLSGRRNVDFFPPFSSIFNMESLGLERNKEYFYYKQSKVS